MNHKKTFLLLNIFSIIFSFSFLPQTVFAQSADFRQVLEKRLSKMQKTTTDERGRKVTTTVKLQDICPVDSNSVAERVFREYGAIFMAEDKVRFPVKCVFANDAEVRMYQISANPMKLTVGGISIELQEPAMTALLEAQKEAARRNLRITPRGGSIAAKRSFQETVDLWYSRFNPGLNYWVGRGKIGRRDAEAVRNYDIQRQVAQVLEWESKGYYFSKDLSKSILYSVAAPGASQHIFMLALDVEQFGNKAVRDILAKWGWFQTVKSDLPHFTYLGVKESDLPELGLKPVFVGGQKFWIPNLD